MKTTLDYPGILRHNERLATKKLALHIKGHKLINIELSSLGGARSPPCSGRGSSRLIFLTNPTVLKSSHSACGLSGSGPSTTNLQSLPRCSPRSPFFTRAMPTSSPARRSSSQEESSFVISSSVLVAAYCMFESCIGCFHCCC